jgi:hypothetical protein
MSAGDPRKSGITTLRSGAEGGEKALSIQIVSKKSPHADRLGLSDDRSLARIESAVGARHAPGFNPDRQAVSEV